MAKKKTAKKEIPYSLSEFNGTGNIPEIRTVQIGGGGSVHYRIQHVKGPATRTICGRAGDFSEAPASANTCQQCVKVWNSYLADGKMTPKTEQPEAPEQAPGPAV